ncbi:uroporphyrinogen-III synthase [Arthrobacter glacialis]|uniref:Uroporphyrinogen-III synthase n=1 Tax=Arthrobacter glacialis TaxID=1664 RepID=A0A2S3ZT25_ARTGL|nr:uroporphyrinogen-III synthase [Arthrobacter glacialis]
MPRRPLRGRPKGTVRGAPSELARLGKDGSVLPRGIDPSALGAESLAVPVVDLAGLRVAVTRSADRAGAFADALAAAGAEPVLVPVIDFEISDNETLGAALGRLAAGEYRWLVVSSITTVRALKQWCETAGTSLADLIPATTSVATIGPTSVAVLAAEGIHAALAPTDLQSAAGLVELWPQAHDGGGRVLLPQSDLAEPRLVEGLNTKGWDTDVVTAYHTVDYPAQDGSRLTASLAHSTRATSPPVNSSYALLTPAQAAQEVQAGVIHAVVLASGSAARRVASTMAPLPDGCLVVAIGQPTRDEAQRLGLRVVATATHPTPAGIVAALAAAHKNFHTK